jgi:hypothetical protein
MAKGHRTRPWRTVFEIDDGGPFAPAASMAAISSGVKGAILAERNKGRWCILGQRRLKLEGQGKELTKVLNGQILSESFPL